MKFSGMFWLMRNCSLVNGVIISLNRGRMYSSSVLEGTDRVRNVISARGDLISMGFFSNGTVLSDQPGFTNSLSCKRAKNLSLVVSVRNIRLGERDKCRFTGVPNLL